MCACAYASQDFTSSLKYLLTVNTMSSWPSRVYEEDGYVASNTEATSDEERQKRVYLYEDDEFPQHTLAALNRLRKEAVLCDVTIVVGESSIDAHRSVLAAVSPYFRAMFAGNFSESRKGSVMIHTLDEASVRAVVEYSYTGLLEVTEENVQALIHTASLFQIDRVCLACCTFMETRLHPHNCLGIQSFADTHGFESLYHKATEEIKEKFPAVVEGEEFLGLEFGKLQELLTSDDLNVDSEDSVLKAALAWLDSNPLEREAHKYDLLSLIRIPLLSPKVLVNDLHSKDLFYGDLKCNQLISDAMAYLLDPSEDSPVRETGMTRPRKGRRSLYVIGGIHSWDGARSNKVQRFQLESTVWESLASMSCPRSGVGVCMVGNVIYAIGGYNGMERVSSGERYDSRTNTWEAIASMPTPRSSLALTQFGSYIFAIGGRNSSHLRVVEKYNIATNEWYCSPTMVEARCYPGTAVHRETLYAIGGFQSNSVECLDVATQSWNIVQKYTNLPLRNPNGAWLDNTLYIVGTQDGNVKEMSVVMAYDERDEQWKEVTRFSTTGNKTRVTASKGQLYVFITNDNGLWIESYDPHYQRTAMVTMLPDLALYSGFVMS